MFNPYVLISSKRTLDKKRPIKLFAITKKCVQRQQQFIVCVCLKGGGIL